MGFSKRELLNGYQVFWFAVMASRPLLGRCALDLEFDHTGIIPFPKREVSNGPIGLSAQIDYASVQFVHFSWADTAPIRHFVPQSNQRSSNRIPE